MGGCRQDHCFRGNSEQGNLLGTQKLPTNGEPPQIYCNCVFMWHNPGKSPGEKPQHRHCLRAEFSVCSVSLVHLHVMGLPGSREPQAVTSSVNKEHFQQQTGLWAGQGRGMGCPSQINAWCLLSHVTDLVLASQVLLLQEGIDHPVSAVCAENTFLELPWEVSEHSPLPLCSHPGQGWG